MPTFEPQESHPNGADASLNHQEPEGANSSSLQQQVAGRSTKKIIAIGAVAAIALTGIGMGAAAMHHPYTIDLDGSVLQSSSWNGTVATALADNNVKISEHDVVTPALDTPLIDGMNIVVDKAHQRAVVIDGEEKQVWSTADTAKELLAEQNAQGREAVVAASRDSVRRELPLVAHDTQVPFLIGRERRNVAVTGGATLEQALAAANVTLGEHDTVRVNQRDGLLEVTVTFVEFKERVETEAIPFDTKTVNDKNLVRGRSRETQKGIAGERQKFFQDTLVNGEVTDSKELRAEVVREPVTRIVAKGTKSRPQSKAPATGGVPAGGVWAALAKCESGGNPRAVSRNGRYHGLYQFSVATWRSVGGSGLPSQASPAEQLKRAKILQARSGWGQWPACSRKIGVR